MRAGAAYAVRALLTTLCDRPEMMTPEQIRDAGKAARRLLTFAWSAPARDRWLAVHGIQCVCRTFETDVEASTALLRRALDPEHLDRYGSEEIHWLADEAQRLIPFKPALIEELYRASFGREEPSDAPSPMGTSRIIGLLSNRRQDWESSRLRLAEIFGTFLKVAPDNAVHALISVLESYVARSHPSASGEVIEKEFDFGGQVARIRTDYSEIWDAREHLIEDPVKMLAAFNKHMEGLAASPKNAVAVDRVIEIIVRENRLAVLWRRLLLLGARYPDVIGQRLRPLLSATPILTAYDTTRAVGALLGALYPSLPPQERERVESAILSIPTQFRDEVEVAEHYRDRLLGCLPPEQIRTREAVARFEELKAAKAVPRNEPEFRFDTWSGPVGEDDFLAEEGVPVSEPANRRIRELEQPVKEFASRFRNARPTSDDVRVILPALEELLAALRRATTAGVHLKQQAYGWGQLADAAGCVATAKAFRCDQREGLLVRGVLLECARYADPEPSLERDASFDASQSWGGPAARLEAAAGLTSLAAHETCADRDVLEAISDLSRDPVPAVRFQVATRLVSLYKTSPESMWLLVERLCREDESRGVLQGLLHGALGPLSGRHADRIGPLAKEIFARITDGPGSEEVRKGCVAIFTGLYVWTGDLQSRQTLLDIFDRFLTDHESARHVMFQLRDALLHGPVEPPDTTQDAVRRRGLDLVARILSVGCSGIRRLGELHASIAFDSWPAEARAEAELFGRVVNDVATELYFASGAFDQRQEGASGSAADEAKRRRFYQEAGSLLDQLAEMGFASVVHHLLQTLESFISFDPRGVFLRIGRTLSAGKAGEYHQESLGADLFVALVERYMAEYSWLFRTDGECRKVLLEALDIFVQAGWPVARRLTYRLDEAFR